MAWPTSKERRDKILRWQQRQRHIAAATAAHKAAERKETIDKEHKRLLEQQLLDGRLDI